MHPLMISTPTKLITGRVPQWIDPCHLHVEKWDWTDIKLPLLALFAISSPVCELLEPLDARSLPLVESSNVLGACVRAHNLYSGARQRKIKIVSPSQLWRSTLYRSDRCTAESDRAAYLVDDDVSNSNALGIQRSKQAFRFRNGELGRYGDDAKLCRVLISEQVPQLDLRQNP